MRFAVRAVLPFLLALPAASQDAELARPDPEVQAAIHDVMHAVGEAEDAAAMDRLRALRSADGRAFVSQLFLYSAVARSTRDGMAFGVLISRLGISERSIVHALVPYFESTDEELRRSAAGTLAEFEGRTIDRPPSFAMYRPFLEKPLLDGQDPPAGLVTHLFDSHAGAALILFMRVATRDPEEHRAILLAEHVIADELWKREFGFVEGDQVGHDVRRHLDAMARHPRWWARLYAASIMRDHPVLSHPDALARLARDTHPFVRRALRSG